MQTTSALRRDLGGGRFCKLSPRFVSPINLTTAPRPDDGRGAVSSVSRPARSAPATCASHGSDDIS
ncbi:MAG TPA: hypothetical protein VNL71_04910, partial [Chloroflexota bacterium]|nr:hypothetical protein [Chloroflexota bacterium]